jgi:4-hydroxy-tetrahydrodipicolinate reductase
MKIYLFGYGQMGKEIEKMAIQKGHTICGICDPHQQKKLNPQELKSADVAIEFSVPDSVIENIYTCFEYKVPVVVGTTGWYDKLDEVSAKCEQNDATLFYASNFSVGVNILFKINQQLASLIKNFPEYKLEIFESHHTKKKDAPSGTAWSLANDIINENDNLNDFKTLEKGSDYEEKDKTFPIYFTREEGVVGIHEITYKSEIDEISIGHKAHSRKGFAAGTLIASEWIRDRKGVFTMKDII